MCAPFFVVFPRIFFLILEEKLDTECVFDFHSLRSLIYVLPHYLENQIYFRIDLILLELDPFPIGFSLQGMRT